jgi:two-component system, LytTR family, response regulator
MIKVIVIEDDHENMDLHLRLLKENLPEVEVIGTGTTNADLIKLVEALEPDVLLLDINLPDGQVFQALEQLDCSAFDIIFTTAYNQYAIQAFEKAAIHYLLKPFGKDQLIQAFQRVRSKKSNEPSSTGVELQIARWLMEQGPNAMEKTGISGVQGVRFVYMKNIVRLEGDDNYTHFVMLDGERILTSHNIGYYIDFYKKNNFIKVHQSHIINLNHLSRYIRGEDAKVELDNGDMVPVARRFKRDLKDRLKVLAELV